MAQSFASVVTESLGSSSSARYDTDPSGIWIHVDWPGTIPVVRGWKLHVSATPWNATDVLKKCLPVLSGERVPFKVAASMERLIELNEGIGGTSQAGKFITVYPPTADVAVRVAHELDRRTAGERGPRVLTDRALSPASIVHYRYADFVEGAPPGEEASPEDPFAASAGTDAGQGILVASRYLVTATLHRSVRGEVLLAVDTQEKRSCVIKRAWRDALVTPDGRDARDRLRDEATVLRKLQGNPHFPALRDLFQEDLDAFLVMEYVEGVPVAKAIARRELGRDIATFGVGVAAALAAMHSAGFVHRDLNPVNVMVNGRVRLIDFELAAPIGRIESSFGAGTEGYVSDNQRHGGPAAVADDLFGLGALLYFVATGSDLKPGLPRSEIERSVDAHCPGVGETVAGLLDQATPRWDSVTPVLELLRGRTPGGREVQ